jgi:hypothetical protein
MNHEATETLRSAACVDLPPEVSDKYFSASPSANPFEHHTARAICRQCVAQTACLEDAISSAAVFAGSSNVIRGGETGAAIQAMRRKHFLEGAPAPALAALAIHQQVDAPSVGSYRHLRSGKFRDAVLATDGEPLDD